MSVIFKSLEGKDCQKQPVRVSRFKPKLQASNIFDSYIVSAQNKGQIWRYIFRKQQRPLTA